MRLFTFHSFLSLVVLVQIAQGTENSKEKPVQKPEVSTEAPSSNDATQVESEAATTTENTEGDEKKYALGSLCNYCTYCKFCELCDKDCPCETSKKKPNCHLCKYCKYCNLCSLCDVVCVPGGVVDVVSSAIYNSLPSFDKDTKEKVDKDIESARKWIKEYL